MKLRAVLAVSAALVSGSCANLSPRANAWLPQAALAAPLRYVVVTVPNEVNAAMPGVSSTPHGYSSVAPYVAGADARKSARAIAQDYRMESVASWPIAMLSVHCLVYRIPADADRDAVLDKLKHDPRVESAQPLENFSTQATITGYNDPYVGLQRNLDELAVPQAQRWSSGKGVRVAVIDTGLDIGHVDLKGRVAAWRNYVDDDERQFRRDRHGTAVAGVIAAVANNGLGIVGIAPEVRLYAYKACWETETHDAAVCNTFTLAQALAAAIDARVDIVNLSLAGPADPLLARLVKRGEEAGIIFVGAAPPVTAPAAAPGFPISVDGVIGVQTSESLTPRRGLIAAPGEDIFTLAPENRYDAASGSSLAAAEVSAIVALLRARDSSVDSVHALRLFEESSRSVMTSAGTRTTINACEAMAVLHPGIDCKELPGTRQVKSNPGMLRAF